MERISNLISVEKLFSKLLEHIKMAENNHDNKIRSSKAVKILEKYITFLDIKLELWMFQPVSRFDPKSVLKEPSHFHGFEQEYKKRMANCYGFTKLDVNNWYDECIEYQQALDRMYFIGGVYNDIQPSNCYNYFSIEGKTIFRDSNTERNCSMGYKIRDIINREPKLTKRAMELIYKMY